MFRLNLNPYYYSSDFTKIRLLRFITIIYIKSLYTYYKNLSPRVNNKFLINLIVVTTKKIVIIYSLKTSVLKLVRILLTTLIILKFLA